MVRHGNSLSLWFDAQVSAHRAMSGSGCGLALLGYDGYECHAWRALFKKICAPISARKWGSPCQGRNMFRLPCHTFGAPRRTSQSKKSIEQVTPRSKTRRAAKWRGGITSQDWPSCKATTPSSLLKMYQCKPDRQRNSRGMWQSLSITEFEWFS